MSNAHNDNKQIMGTTPIEQNQKLHRRKASFTEAEAFILSRLLIDDAKSVRTSSKNKQDGKGTAEELQRLITEDTVLNHEMLFTVPVREDGISIWMNPLQQSDALNGAFATQSRPTQASRDNAFHIGLWRAHEEGVTGKRIRKLSTIRSSGKSSSHNDVPRPRKSSYDSRGSYNSSARQSSIGSLFTQRTDQEVRPARSDSSLASSASSWDESEGGFDHYDAWAVLKDEYAADFGFDYDQSPNFDDDEADVRHFKILGTSADDMAAHPHVLSPPLMESLMNFVPDALQDSNLWLKFSLVRDGASLQTLKRYVRAATHTIMAIETTDGAVFGSFTSCNWRNEHGYYGNGEAFLWRMRQSRLTPVYSMIEQAELESEVDIYPFSGLNTYVQLCLRDKIAVGGGDLDVSGLERHGDEIAPDNFLLSQGESYGFGLAINADLFTGTSSPCATFRNACLSSFGDKGHVFEIVNLEVWGFTCCDNVKDAERLELSKFFTHESIRSSMSSMSMMSNGNRRSDVSADLCSVEKFYKRVGDDEDFDDRWDHYVKNADAIDSGGNKLGYLLS